ncbi:hypothetical protein M407DRAFT_119781 [Tulasnella calospora MUT 4182]|uniref:Uncharacterized protein n=1 Tax=Tulasnella calospora MUT 4182 TaxID=1051891 RepID=A0A0C3Q1P0_9AGAM|nr:hypothetical protein M407DRAFT_119781 [Tulasnella calospora MUT 4182]
MYRNRLEPYLRWGVVFLPPLLPRKLYADVSQLARPPPRKLYAPAPSLPHVCLLVSLTPTCPHCSSPGPPPLLPPTRKVYADLLGTSDVPTLPSPVAPTSCRTCAGSDPRSGPRYGPWSAIPSHT